MANTMPVLNSSPIALSAPSSARDAHGGGSADIPARRGRGRGCRPRRCRSREPVMSSRTASIAVEIFAPGLNSSRPLPVGGKAGLVDVEIARLRLAEAEGALDVGEIAAELRMHLADDHVALLQRPHGRHAERMRIGVLVAGPEEQRRLLAAVRQHGLHHAGIDLAFLDAGPRGVAAGRQHQVAELRGLVERRDLLGALHDAELLQHVVEIDDLRARHADPVSRSVDAVRRPAVRIERAGEAVDADLGAGQLQFGQPVGDAVGQGALARPHVGDPVLRALPVVGEHRRIDEARSARPTAGRPAR